VEIYFFYEKEEYKVFDEKSIKNWIELAAKSEGKKLGEINCKFVSEKEIVKINRNFLNHDYSTDIITFDESLVNIINGQIVISPDTVYYNAKIFNSEALEELHRVIIHGIMHLCGYKDSTEKEKEVMRNKEDTYLSYLEKI